MPSGKRGARGFTLVELLVVLSIIALLLTIALPRYFGSLDKSREVVLAQNLETLRHTIDKFYADKGSYPESLNDLKKSGYIRAIPMDPITESTETWVLMKSTEGAGVGVVDVKSGAPGNSRSGQPYAEF